MPLSRFQDDLERRLRADPSLGGRLARRTRASGGFTDPPHDGIVCELKVVDDKAVTLETADLTWVGQRSAHPRCVLSFRSFAGRVSKERTGRHDR